jgi:hypothetical protein
MAAVVVTILKRKKIEDNREIVNANLAFGDGSTTYPALGIPVPGALFSCPRAVDSLVFSDEVNGSPNIYKYDQINQKIRIWIPTTGAEFSGVIPSVVAKVQVIGAK